MGNLEQYFGYIDQILISHSKFPFSGLKLHISYCISCSTLAFSGYVFALKLESPGNHFLMTLYLLATAASLLPD